MKEPEVKKAVYQFLSNNRVLNKEYDLPAGGRIDYITFDWKDEYDIEICGYECKGSPSPKTIARILGQQVAEYQKSIPQVYLVLHTKKKGQLEVLCELNGIGLLIVDDERRVEIVVKPPDPPQPLLNNHHFEQLRSTAAMFLTFKECFGRDTRKGSHWCSTPEENTEAQFNIVSYSSDRRVDFSVNLENCRRVMKTVDLKELQKEISTLPDGYWVDAWLENYYAPRIRVGMSFFRREASQVTVEDLRYLRRKATSALVHLQIATHLWSYDEFLPKQAHTDIFRSAQKQLSQAYTLLHAY